MLSVAIQHKLYGLSIILLNAVILIICHSSPVGIISRLVAGIIYIRDSIYVVVILINRLFYKRNASENDASKCRKKNNVLCVLPTYKEDAKDVKMTLDSLLYQNGIDDLMNLRILMICDGYFNYADLFTELTLIEVLNYETFTKTENKVSIYKSTYEGCDLAILIKKMNSGKKDSLILVDNVFVCDKYNSVRNTIIDNIFRVPQFDHIFHTDADTFITKNTVSVANNILASDDEITAVTGFVLVPEKNSFWCLLQGFEYYYEQIICRVAESCWGKLFILPGCINMVNVKTSSIVEASRKFQRLPTEENIFQINDRLQGTDRRYTNCLLDTPKKVKIVFSPDMCSYTIPPCSFYHFLSQRNRWLSNAISGYIYRATGKCSSWYERLLALTELFYIHTCVARLLVLFGILYHVTDLESYDMVFTSFFVLIPYIFCFIHILQSGVYGWFLLAGCFTTMIVSPFLNVFVFVSCVVNFSSVLWGKTHEAIPNKKSFS